MIEYVVVDRDFPMRLGVSGTGFATFLVVFCPPDLHDPEIGGVLKKIICMDQNLAPKSIDIYYSSTGFMLHTIATM